MLTVFFATRNGERILPQVLGSFAALQSPPGGWKLVVIDNGSTDGTKEILSSSQQKLPLTFFSEPTPGKNAALNAGLVHLEGDLAVFTDDDVFPHADWLVRLREAADTNPDYSMFGGAIVARWQVAPPEWMQWVPRGAAFALTEPSWPDGPTEPINLFGPNMAIRAQVFAKGTRFDPTIGPRGANYAMGSESELLLRLGSEGHKAWHVKNAVVEHFIRDYQMQRSWVLGRALRYGRGSFRRAKAADPSLYPYYLGQPLRLLLKLIKPRMKIAASGLTMNKKKLFLARWEFNYLRGYVVEARIYRKTGKQSQ